MGFREIKSDPISELYEDKTTIPIQIVPQSSVTIPLQNRKVSIPKSAFAFPFKPRPTPAKPLPDPAPEPIPEVAPDPIPHSPQPTREPVVIQEMIMEPQPTVKLNPQPRAFPPQQFVPFIPPEPQPTTGKQITLPSITIPELNTTNAKKYGKSLVKMAVAIVLVWFGLTSTGSYFGPASGKFGGQLAQVFYQYQIGTLIACCGIVLAYDAISRLR